MNPAYLSWANTFQPRGRGGPTFMLTLMRLGQRANHAGAVQLGVREIARLLGRHERQAQRVLHQLAADGWIAIEPQFAGRTRMHVANRYYALTAWVRKQLEPFCLFSERGWIVGRREEGQDQGVVDDVPPRHPPPRERVYRRPDGGWACIHFAEACAECLGRTNANDA